MGIHENVSGTWKRVLQPSVNVSGTDKAITAAYENVSGVWKRFLPTVNLTDHSTASVAPADVTMTVIFTTAGALGGSFFPDNEWLAEQPTSGINGLYQFKLDVTSGNGPETGPSTGSWITMTTVDLKWVSNDWAFGANTWKVSIRDASTMTVLDSADFTMNRS